MTDPSTPFRVIAVREASLIGGLVPEPLAHVPCGGFPNRENPVPEPLALEQWDQPVRVATG